MGISFAVSVIFKSKDEQSKNFNRMGKNAKKFGRQTDKAFKRASKSANKFGTITKGILAAGAVQKVLGGVSAGLRSVTTDFLDFDNAVLSASAKFKGLDITTKEGIKTLNELKKTARIVGRDTEFNAAQAASGLDFLALAGFNAKQAMALLPGVTNLATVAQVDLATATDIASDSLGAFGLMTSDTEKLTTNFKRVQDVMAKTTATSNTNLTDLFEAVKKGAPDFTAAGQSIETFSTLIGTMANSGIKGSEAGTKLRNIAVRLAGPTKEAAEAMEQLGIRVDDGKGKFRDMLLILDDVRKGTSKLGEVQRAAALKTIFGARQTGGLNVLLKEGAEKLSSYRDMLEASAGASEKMAEIMRSSLLNRLKSLGSAATEVGFQLFSAFDKQGAGAIDRLTQFVRKIDLTPFINGIKTIAEFSGKMLEKFKKIGEESGLFDKIREGAKQLAPHFETVFDIAKTMFKLFEDVGGFTLLANSIGLVVDVAVLMSKGMVAMWKIVKPILTAIPDAINAVIKGFDNLSKKGIFGGKEFAEKSAGIRAKTKARREKARFDRLSPAQQAAKLEQLAGREKIKEQVRAANQTQLESRATQVDISGRINFGNAPEGTTFTPESAPANNIDIGELGPAGI